MKKIIIFNVAKKGFKHFLIRNVIEIDIKSFCIPSHFGVHGCDWQLTSTHISPFVSLHANCVTVALFSQPTLKGMYH